MIADSHRTLSDVAEVVRGTSPSGDTCNEKGKGIPLLNGPTEFGSHHPDPVQYTVEPKKFAQPGDLLFCVRGSTTGRMNWADQEYAIGRGLAAIRAEEDKDLQPYIRALVEYRLGVLLQEATGSTFPNVSLSQLRGLEIPKHNLPTQRRIADILGALDDKIELNRRMNETLEAMAQALYRHWFVDFGPFQDREFTDTEELGPIPKGWDTAPLDEVASFLNGTQWSRYKPEDEEEETLQVIKIKELRNGFTEKSDEVSKEDLLNKYIIEDGDIIFSWSGSLLLRIWSDGQGALNQHLFKVSSEQFPKWFYYEGVRHHIERFRHIAESKATTMGHIKRSHLSESHVAVPPEEVMEEIHEKMHPIMRLRISNLIESRKLSETRDYLLPKLISGEIEVDAAERKVGEVAEAGDVPTS
ncbi:type I restriction enzyme S subunit [Salinibacter ruber]|uniref:restriction endonuclease subunit S n=1 Tax=Salinibacter ruber TaxID=146919 RepID=UPI00216A97A5|nr:restriction endonuclease subunit S [Salinibacter ruber]MCS3956723.1 type I restriction enzyme S subunit [Salinibacter ruber]